MRHAAPAYSAARPNGGLSLPKSRIERTGDVAAKDWMRNDVSEPLDRACAGRVPPERNLRSHLLIIDGISRNDSPNVLRVERDQMISVLAPDRPDQAFSISVMPGQAERGGPLPDARTRALNVPPNALSLSRMRSLGAVSQGCFDDLARQPLRRWVLGHRKPQQLPPSMAKNRNANSC